MKQKLSVLFLSLSILVSMSAAAQSQGINVLKNRFSGYEDVFAITLNGFLARTAIKFVEEEEYKDAITKVRSISVITIPKNAFNEQEVTVKGYRNFLQENNFEKLIEVKENGESVTFYLNPNTKRDTYLILIDELGEVTVVELIGNIDISKIKQVKLSASNL